VTSLLLTAALAQAPPTITNAQVEARAATQSVEREIAALAARRDDRWVGYRVAVSGSRRSMDCYERSRIRSSRRAKSWCSPGSRAAPLSG